MWCTNCFSIRNKWKELTVSCKLADVVAVTETWLSGSDPVSDLLTSISAYRLDRPGDQVGGGVILLIKSHYGNWEDHFFMKTSSINVVSCFLRLEGGL